MDGWRRKAAGLAIPAMMAAAVAGAAAVSRWAAPPVAVLAGPTSPGGEAEQLSPPNETPLPGEYRGPTAEQAVEAMERRWAEEGEDDDATRLTLRTSHTRARRPPPGR